MAAEQIRINDKTVIEPRPGAKRGVYHFRVLKPDGRTYKRGTTKTADPVTARMVALDVYKRMYPGASNVANSFTKAAHIMLNDVRHGPHSHDPKYVGLRERTVEHYLVPYFADTPICNITDNDIDDYLRWRREHGRSGLPSPVTLNNENTVIRSIFEAARLARFKNRDGSPFQTRDFPLIRNVSVASVEPRPGFTFPEYMHLLKTAHERFRLSRDLAVARHCRSKKIAAADLSSVEKQAIWWGDPHARARLILWLCCRLIGGTGMRPKTARQLTFRHVAVPQSDPHGLILRGETKKGDRRRRWSIVPKYDARRAIRWLVNYRRLRNVEMSDPLLPHWPSEASINRLIEAAGLTYDEYGDKRTIYSLRHFYITQAALEGLDRSWIAKNTMTSERVIESYYDKAQTEAWYDKLR